MAKKRLKALIAYVNVGGGFKSPAMAISEELESLGVECVMSDFFLESRSDAIDHLIKDGWKLSLKHPWTFDLVYGLSDNRFRLLERLLQAAYEKRMVSLIKSVKPDFIVSLYFSSTFIIGRIVKKHFPHIPVIGYHTDAIVAHQYYVSNDIAAYFVPTKEGYADMLRKGQKPSLLKMGSFAIGRKFKKKFSSQKIERKKLGLKDMFTALIVFGGEGIGKIHELFKAIGNKGKDMQLIVVCGRNEAMRLDLEALKGKMPFELVVKGFVDNMQDYMYASDVVMGKSGINMVFESLFMKKPFIAFMALANEKFAAHYLLKHNAGWWPKSAEKAGVLLTSLPANSGLLARIRKNISKVGVNYDTARMAKDMLAIARREI
jgi:processive 1,2-diacylglycerol beta-glucosyltransferase